MSSSQAVVARRHINLPGRKSGLPFSDAVLVGDTLYLAGRIGIDPVTGNFGSTSTLLIAVSATNNPLGNWNVYSVDVSQDGDARP